MTRLAKYIPKRRANRFHLEVLNSQKASHISLWKSVPLGVFVSNFENKMDVLQRVFPSTYPAPVRRDTFHNAPPELPLVPGRPVAVQHRVCVQCGHYVANLAQSGGEPFENNAMLTQWHGNDFSIFCPLWCYDIGGFIRVYTTRTWRIKSTVC